MEPSLSRTKIRTSSWLRRTSAITGLLVVMACRPLSSPPGAVAATPARPGAGPAAPDTPFGPMTVGPSRPAGNNVLANAGFTSGALRPWSVNVGSAAGSKVTVTSGELCISVAPATGPFGVVLRQSPVASERGHKYQVRLKARSTVPARIRPRFSKMGPPYTPYWSARLTVDATPRTFTGSFVGAVDNPDAELVIELEGPAPGTPAPTVCFDDLELNDPQFEIPPERDAPPPPRLNANQVGYLPGFAKIATVVSDAKTAEAWELLDAAGVVVARGTTTPFGWDAAAGQSVHVIDFSEFKRPGKGYRLRVRSDESFPFEIGHGVYDRLKLDALAFFYLQRSGVPIRMPYAGTPVHERPAGHEQDKRVPCAPQARCSYTLDVSGGWYDAGDHGKYVVNGGLSTWMLQNQVETARFVGGRSWELADGSMNIPERGNGVPDLLDEARFNLEFMLRMQVPAGQPMAGMAHHKVHGERWSDLPTLPHADPVKRFLRPVSTAATLNLAAVAAQAARLWKPFDPAFARRCLQAAETAFQAAQAHPRVLAEGPVQGGGAYGDHQMDDERYWAAVELFITTGEAKYRELVVKAPHHRSIQTGVIGTTASMHWEHVATLGKISLAVVPNSLGDGEVKEQRRQIVSAADRFLKIIEGRGYRMPLEPTRYAWGSNDPVLTDGLMLGLAYELTHDAKYANGAIQTMDYLLGRNPLGQSYVAGYGARPMRNPHHRFWAHQKDARLPGPPPGAISGGPNSELQDPYIRKVGLGGCPAQMCYVDHVDSYSTNEVAINWNAALAWDAAFLDRLARRASTAPVAERALRRGH